MKNTKCTKIKPKPKSTVISNNRSYVCAYHCAQMQTMPDFNHSLLQFVNTVNPHLVHAQLYPHLVHAMLYYTPILVVDGIWVQTENSVL